LILDVALGKSGKVSIFGFDYPTADGTAVRDYIHVSDLAAAHIKALDHVLSGGPSMALNLGTGQGASVGEIVACAERVSGRAIKFEKLPRRAGDPACLIADPSAAAARLGWIAMTSGLEEIVRDAWAWHSKRH
jgi:UDP-glucose 4-epimerase